ncbi:MAG: FixH family protein [Ignavibacteriae bacterium]|nr:FixH family protein [Ignavibacteriota bacterium]
MTHNEPSPQRKSFWPIGLTIFLAVFVVVTVGVAFFISREKVDLVTERAYEKGIAYQAQIDVLERTKALAIKPAVSWADGNCVITFADSTHAADATGMLTFFKPDDAAQDFKVVLALDERGIQRVPFGEKKSGRWNIGIAWTHAGNEYFLEEAVFAQ